MKLPSRYCVQSAQRCARLIGLNPVAIDAMESSFHSAVTQGMYRAQDLRSGQDLLEQLQLVSRDSNTLYPDVSLMEFGRCSEDEAIRIALAHLLQEEPPVWLASAVEDDTIIYEYIPTEVTLYLDSILPDIARREAIVLAAARKYDHERLQQIGLEGELAVLDACRDYLTQAGREDLVNDVIHVSQISDQLGYDIVAPTLDGGTVRIEVKSTATIANYAAYISRLEAVIGNADQDWRLVFCQLVHGEAEVIGHCSFNEIEYQLPLDRLPGEWSSTKLQLRPIALQPGVPL